MGRGGGSEHQQKKVGVWCCSFGCLFQIQIKHLVLLDGRWPERALVGAPPLYDVEEYNCRPYKLRDREHAFADEKRKKQTPSNNSEKMRG